MSEFPTVPVVFLSYAGTERRQALDLRGALEHRGLVVTMDDSFEPGESVLVNTGRALDAAAIVVAIVSAQYLDRHFTEIEVSTVLSSPAGKLLPVVIGEEPEPATDRGRNLWSILKGRSYFRTNGVQGDEDRLAAAIRDKVGKPSEEERSDSSGASFQPDRSREFEVIYDWEDSHLLAQVELSLNGQEIVPLAAASASGRRSETREVGVFWTSSAQTSPEVASAILDRIAHGQRVVYLLQETSPPTPSGATSVRLQLKATPASATRVRRSRRDRNRLLAGLEEFLGLNDGIPPHLLGDKFCVSRAAAVKAAEMYHLAVSDFPRGFDVKRAAHRRTARPHKARADPYPASGCVPQSGPFSKSGVSVTCLTLEPSAFAV